MKVSHQFSSTFLCISIPTGHKLVNNFCHPFTNTCLFHILLLFQWLHTPFCVLERKNKPTEICFIISQKGGKAVCQQEKSLFYQQIKTKTFMGSHTKKSDTKLNKSSPSANLPRSNAYASVSVPRVISQTLFSPCRRGKDNQQKAPKHFKLNIFCSFLTQNSVTSSTWHCIMIYIGQIIGSGTSLGTFETRKLIKEVIKRLFVLGATVSALVRSKLQLKLATHCTMSSIEISHKFQSWFRLCLCAICWYRNVFVTQKKKNKSSKWNQFVDKQK